MPTFSDKLSYGLNNPLFGMGVGLMSGGDTGGSLASGAQQGLLNMQAMGASQQQREMQAANIQKMEEAAAERERVRKVREQALQGLQPMLQGQEAETGPFMGPMAGGQMPTGLMQTAPAEPGLMQTNPMMANYLQSQPLEASEAIAKAQIEAQYGQTPGGMTYAQYQSATPDQRAVYDAYKGREDNATPAKIQQAEYYAGLSPAERVLYDRSNRAPQQLDVGTGYYSPGSGDFTPKNTVQAGVQAGEGTNISKGLSSFPLDLEVAEAFISDIDQTKSDLARLSGMTDYTTTGVSSFLKNLPATDQRAWHNIKTTMQSRLGLSKIMELKASSASGSTGFGALNEKELELLVSNLGMLDQASDPKEIKRIILKITNQLDSKSQRMRRGIDQKIDFYKANRYRLEGYKMSDEEIAGYISPIPTGLDGPGATSDGWSIREK